MRKWERRLQGAHLWTLEDSRARPNAHDSVGLVTLLCGLLAFLLPILDPRGGRHARECRCDASLFGCMARNHSWLRLVFCFMRVAGDGLIVEFDITLMVFHLHLHFLPSSHTLRFPLGAWPARFLVGLLPLPAGQEARVKTSNPSAGYIGTYLYYAAKMGNSARGVSAVCPRSLDLRMQAAASPPSSSLCGSIAQAPDRKAPPILANWSLG